MTVRPSAPHELDRIASIGASIETSSRCALVAVHVRCAYGGGLHETDILVKGIPSCGLGTAVLWVVVPHGIRAVGEGSFDVHTLHEAVGRCGVEEDGDCAQEKGGGVHAAGCVKTMLARLWRGDCDYCPGLNTVLLITALIRLLDVAGAIPGFQPTLTRCGALLPIRSSKSQGFIVQLDEVGLLS